MRGYCSTCGCQTITQYYADPDFAVREFCLGCMREELLKLREEIESLKETLSPPLDVPPEATVVDVLPPALGNWSVTEYIRKELDTPWPGARPRVEVTNINDDPCDPDRGSER